MTPDKALEVGIEACSDGCEHYRGLANSTRAGRYADAATTLAALRVGLPEVIAALLAGAHFLENMPDCPGDEAMAERLRAALAALAPEGGQTP